jgi:GTP-binding protein EngB required for normal cell division
MALESNLSRLTEAVELCQDRIDPVVHADARTALDKAGNRLSISPEATVIAVAGATGAGKSSIFNALSRQAFAQVGVRRPMTTDAMAITFGSLDTTQLVDWLQISQHHVVADNELSGIVLLDLADFDSVEVGHREEFDRLAQVVDQFLWVVDPQKYADAALHERYLRSFASHSDVMTFVLNHVDKLSASELKAIEKDLVRILEDDGIRKPSLFAVSAATGWGIDKLRAHLAKLAKARKALVLRLEADMLVHARAMNSQVGVRAAGTLGKKETSTMTQGCIEAAGVDEIVDAVQVSMARRGRQMTGLPWLGWMNKFRVDPLKRLHLDQFTSKKNKALESPQITRSSRDRKSVV